MGQQMADLNKLLAPLRDVAEIFAKAEAWKAQGLCPHCGGQLKGLFSKKCAKCGKLPDKPAATVTLAGFEWRVLDVKGSSALLISEDILEKRAYNFDSSDVTWGNCTMRKYLNNRFLYDDIDEIEPAIVYTTNNSFCLDKVFLLSIDEVCKYFGDSEASQKKAWIKNAVYVDDKNNSARIASYANEGASAWWLRSFGFEHDKDLPFVCMDGRVDREGKGQRNIDCGLSLGMRPAMWVEMEVGS